MFNLGSINFSLGANTQGLMDAINRIRTFTGAYLQSCQQMRVGANQVTGSLRNMSDVSILVAGPLSGVATRLGVLARVARDVDVSFAAMVAGVASGIYVFSKVGSAAVATAKDIEKITQTLTAVTNSPTVAATQMKYLMDVSNRAGISFVDTSKQYARLQAAAKGTSVEGERMNNIFEATVFAAAKLGSTTEETGGVIRALEQIISKGSIQAEELRGQLGDRLPGAMQIMATALGTTTQKLDGMMKKGELTSSMLVKFADAMKARYNIDTSKNVDTITGAENRFRNALITLNDTMDKTVGFSTAYKNALNSLTGIIGQVTSNLSPMITGLGAVAGAFAGVASAAVLTGLGSLTRLVVGLTTGIWGLSAALNATPLGIITAIARLGLAVGGAYLGYQLMTEAIDNNAKSMTNNLPEVEAYIASQKSLTTSVRGATQEYIDQTKKRINQYDEQIDSIKRLMDAEAAAEDSQRAAGEPITIGRKYTELATQLSNVELEASKARETLKSLDDILQRQTAAETATRTDPIKEMTNKQVLALKNAQDTIRELNQEFSNMYKAPAAKEYGNIQVEINKQVEDFRDKLTRAGIPAERVVELTNKYADALQRVKVGNYELQHTISTFQAFEGIFSRGMDTAINTFVDGIWEAKSVMEMLSDVAKSVAQDIMKTFLQLAIANPIKNMLFGTNYTTSNGIGGIGGLLGGLFGGVGAGGLGGGIGGSEALAAVTGYGLYAKGGVTDRPAIFGDDGAEAAVPLPDGRRIPVDLRGSGAGGGVSVTVAPTIQFQAPIPSSVNAQASMAKQVRKELESLVNEVLAKQLRTNGVLAR